MILSGMVVLCDELIDRRGTDAGPELGVLPRLHLPHLDGGGVEAGLDERGRTSP